MQRRSLLQLLSVGCLAPAVVPHAQAATSAAPAIWLANTYRPSVALSDYWVSEKYDGVRGYWDGHQLLTRSGAVVHAPSWFTHGWPSTPAEGELWLGRGQFSETLSVLLQDSPNDAAWRQLHFMVFDAPTHVVPFTQRIRAYTDWVHARQQAWVLAIEQRQVASTDALRQLLKTHVAAGAEGLMLHKGDAYYRSGRSDDQLKFKPHDDAEARVVGHIAGTGKHAGRTGALLVETPQGQRFKLGTGLRDAERQNPPPVGQWITYRYQGLTSNGLPRFASYLRVRPSFDQTLTQSAK